MMIPPKVIFRLALLAVAAGTIVILWRRPSREPANLFSAAEIQADRAGESPALPAPEDGAPVIPASSPDRLPPTNQTLLTFLESPSPFLSPAGLQTALDYLRDPAPASSADEPAAEYFNNVIALVLAQPELPVEFPAVLLGTVNDPDRPLLLRDYAMQHLYHAWIRERNAAAKQQIENCLRQTMGDIESPLQAVALLTISRLVGQGPVVTGPNGEKVTPIGNSQPRSVEFVSRPLSFESGDVVNAALLLTENVYASNNARSCAFNVLLRLGANQAIYPARRVIRDPVTPDDVRCAALASLGAFGNSTEDRSLLDSIPQKPQLVRAAADAALRRLLKSQSGR